MPAQTTRRPVVRAPKAITFSPAKQNRALHKAALGLLLVAATLVLYSPVRDHDFLTYDDYQYVVYNAHVNAGLKWQTVQWALTSMEEANWHPLTWLSHALDSQLFGLNAGCHHLTNVAIHALNVLLLFLLLKQATGAVGRSFFVAALFAWHPFNVGSVAWVAERKNVLSTLFFLLTLGAYGWYARKPEIRRFILVVVFFIMALASKPMAVTLPFVLLLLDYWPLQRIKGWTEMSPRFSIPQQSIPRLALEKGPLFLLSAASSVITIWAQKRGGAVESLQAFPFTTRLAIAVHSYASYIWKTFWPAGFALYYPHAGTSVPLWKLAVAMTFLCAISFLAWTQRTTKPYIVVGWLWFLGTLLPVIGIVQVGDQEMADRYAYLPLIGLFILITWGLADWLDLRRVGAAPRWACAAIALVSLSFVSYRELGFWRDSSSIWTHALQSTGGNLKVEKQLGSSLLVLGRSSEALPHLAKVASSDPTDVVTHIDNRHLFPGDRPRSARDSGIRNGGRPNGPTRVEPARTSSTGHRPS